MDEVETKSNSEVKDIPPIPIKTYHWEDVKRAKKKGGYPYTHLFKEPYDEEVDPEEFTMEAFRRSKSASTLGKSESGVVIQDVTDETKVVSKDYLDVGGMYKSEGIVESADSSAEDNISQYLDKDDDDRPTIIEQVEVPGPSTEATDETAEKMEKMEVDEERQDSRAKSEEPKRKRKLSIESSYSRISLSRLGMMKKLREAKDKIKLPKFSFSKSDSKLNVPKKFKKGSKKGEEKESETNTESKKSKIESKNDEGPLYIHIPLKPPPGQTDEFSYLEFENKRDNNLKKDPTPIPENVEKEEEEAKEQEANVSNDVQLIILTAPSDDEILDDHASVPDTPSSIDNKKFFDNSKIKELKSLAKGVVDEISPETKIIFEDVIQVEYVDENNRPIGKTEESKFIEITDENLPTIEKQLSQRNILKELEKEIKSSRDSLNKIVKLQQEQVKESSKLAGSKEKLQEPTKEIITTKEDQAEEIRQETPTPDKTEEMLPTQPDIRPITDDQKIEEMQTEDKTVGQDNTEQKEQLIVTNDVEKLEAKENKGKAGTKIKKGNVVKKKKAKELVAKETENNKVETKDSKQSDISTEMPIGTDRILVQEEANIKKETKIMVDEEDGLKLSDEAVKLINEEFAKEQLPKMDEESLKANIKPVGSLKKKVSFKRKSKQDDPDGIYEDVQVTSDKSKESNGKDTTKEMKVIDNSQSMSVDEEKTYLDDKIIKTTSLEEDYNKWSKLPDYCSKEKKDRDSSSGSDDNHEVTGVSRSSKGNIRQPSNFSAPAAPVNIAASVDSYPSTSE